MRQAQPWGAEARVVGPKDSDHLQGTISVPRGILMAASAQSGLARIASYFLSELRARRAERELLAMTDRELADIGVTRYDVGRVLRARDVVDAVGSGAPRLSGDRGYRAA